jgi:hypothetical protein
MLYVVIHHYSNEEANANDYLIGVFDTPEAAFQAREEYFSDFSEIKNGIHSISITPVKPNTYNDYLICNVPWLNCNGEWEEEEI